MTPYHLRITDSGCDTRIRTVRHNSTDVMLVRNRPLPVDIHTELGGGHAENNRIVSIVTKIDSHTWAHHTVEGSLSDYLTDKVLTRSPDYAVIGSSVIGVSLTDPGKFIICVDIGKTNHE